jgi:hypothetical protein
MVKTELFLEFVQDSITVGSHSEFDKLIKANLSRQGIRTGSLSRSRSLSLSRMSISEIWFLSLSVLKGFSNNRKANVAGRSI